MPQPPLSLLDLASARTGTVIPGDRVRIIDGATYQRVISRQIFRIAAKVPDGVATSVDHEFFSRDEFRLQDDGSLHIYLANAHNGPELMCIPKGAWELASEADASESKQDKRQDITYRQQLRDALNDARRQLAQRDKELRSIEWNELLYILCRDQHSLHLIAYIGATYQSHPEVTDLLNEWLAGNDPMAALHVGERAIVLTPLPHFGINQLPSVVAQLVEVLRQHGVDISDTVLTTFFDEQRADYTTSFHGFWTLLGGKSLDYPKPYTMVFPPPDDV